MRPRGGSRVAEVRWCSLHLRVDGEGDCGGCLMVVRERRCWMREDGTVVVFRDGGAKARRWCCGNSRWLAVLRRKGWLLWWPPWLCARKKMVVLSRCRFRRSAGSGSSSRLRGEDGGSAARWSLVRRGGRDVAGGRARKWQRRLVKVVCDGSCKGWEWPTRLAFSGVKVVTENGWYRCWWLAVVAARWRKKVALSVVAGTAAVLYGGAASRWFCSRLWRRGGWLAQMQVGDENGGANGGPAWRRRLPCEGGRRGEN